MKEYLKMSDVFNGSVLNEQATAYTLKSRGFRHGEEVFVNDVWASFNGHDEAAKYASHAINSHDELVQMNKGLLAALEALDDIYSDTSRDYLTRAELQHHKAVRADVKDIIAKEKGGVA